MSTYLTEETNEIKKEVKPQEAIIKGMPGMVLLPLRAYALKTLVSSYTFSIPMSGRFSELYPDFFESAGKTEETDCFSIVVDIEDNKQVLPVEIMEIMFASGKYPELTSNQVFSIGNIIINDKDNVLQLNGTLFEFVE